MKKNHTFIIEHEKFGKLLLMDIDNGQTAILRMKDSVKICTINAAWWDLDAIRKEIATHEKEIIDGLSDCKATSMEYKLYEIMDELDNLPVEKANKVRREIQSILITLKSE